MPSGTFQVVDIPEDMIEKAQLAALGYASLLEALGEKFHAKPALLRSLNPRATWVVGEDILVPHVIDNAIAAAPALTRNAARDIAS